MDALQTLDLLLDTERDLTDRLVAEVRLYMHMPMAERLGEAVKRLIETERAYHHDPLKDISTAAISKVFVNQAMRRAYRHAIMMFAGHMPTVEEMLR